MEIKKLIASFFLLLYPIASFSIRGPKEGFILSTLILLVFVFIYLYRPDLYNLYSFIFFLVAYLMVSYLLYYYRFYENLNFAKINRSLENQINQRTYELSLQLAKLKEKEDQLIWANQKIVDASHEKSRFLAAASHDLRQPIHAMGFQIETFKQAYQDSDLLAQIDSLSDCHHVLSQSINTLMDISKLDSGTIEIKKIYFQVQRLFDNLNTELSPAAKKKGISLRFRDTKEWMYSDPEQLQLVFSNIIGNAIKFTEKNGVLVCCRLQGKQLSLEVWDTGPGIPKNKIGEVFKEYIQLAQPISRQSHGLGLGLSIVKRICHLLDHPFSLNSRVAKGTCFKLKVARSQVDKTQIFNSSPIISFSLRGSLILLLDDDREVLNTTKNLLESWQCRVITAENIAQAVAKVENEDIDLIIADYQLSNQETGTEAIEIINDLLGTESKSILVTGLSNPNILETISQSGLTILQKPIAPALLRSSIHKLLHS